MIVVEGGDSISGTMETRYIVMVAVPLMVCIINNMSILQYSVVVQDPHSAEMAKHVPDRAAVSL